MTNANKKLKYKLQKNRRARLETKQNLIYITTKVLILLVVLYVMVFKIFGLQTVNNEGMSPSLKAGTLTVYYRLDKDYTRYDVISASIEGKNNVYRIIGLPGDKIDITEDGTLLINGHTEEKEEFYKTIRNNNSDISFPLIVKENEIFVLNDYRTATNDSRTFGTINKDSINGKVIAKLQIRDF